MAIEPTRYAAFISYRHMPRDRRWALRIMSALETFRTPKPLVSQAYPARIAHLFRDEDEIRPRPICPIRSSRPWPAAKI